MTKRIKIKMKTHLNKKFIEVCHAQARQHIYLAFIMNTYFAYIKRHNEVL